MPYGGRMDELTVLFWAVVLRLLGVIACIAGAVYLAYHEKTGWGWLVFTAIVLGSFNYNYTKD